MRVRQHGCPMSHFVCEVHYLPAILQKTQYDSIYHEHLRSYSLLSLVVLFHLYGFSVVHAEVMSRYSGTVRVFARRRVCPHFSGFRVNRSPDSALPSLPASPLFVQNFSLDSAPTFAQMLDETGTAEADTSPRPTPMASSFWCLQLAYR